MKIDSLKLKLSFVQTEVAKKDDELPLVKASNFEINQRLTKTVEYKDAPYIDYISALLDTNLQPLFSKMSITEGVSTSNA